MPNGDVPLRVMLDTNIKELDDELFNIRDADDYPVLYSAIIEDVDLFVTGDDDFDDVGIEKPEIISPSDFLAKY